ncbi:hypothetical protein JC221_131 [Yersinia phage JC221]|nr:hypothetical protein JC221_131 [Yersinia phage JC221]
MRKLMNLIEIGMYVMAAASFLDGAIGKYMIFFIIGLIISVFKKRFKL